MYWGKTELFYHNCALEQRHLNSGGSKGTLLLLVQCKLIWMKSVGYMNIK